MHHQNNPGDLNPVEPKQINQSLSSSASANPKISVLIISYNAGQYIEECIASIVAQTLQPYEIIIADDHSTDESWGIITKYKDKYPHLIRSYRQERNLGMLENGAFAWNQVRGDLVSAINSDDRWFPNKLELEWEALKKNPDARVAYSNVFQIDEYGNQIKLWHDDTKSAPPQGDVFIPVFTRKFFNNSGSVFRNELIYYSAFQSVGGRDKNMILYLDWDRKIRLSAHYPIVYSGAPLVEYRIHAGGIHNSPPDVHYRSIKAIFEKNLPLAAMRPSAEFEQIKRSVLAELNNLKKQMDRQKQISIKSADDGKNGGLPDANSSDSLNLSDDVDTYSDENLIFLISQPRAGSTLLQRILAGHPQIHTTAEPWIMLHPLYALKSAGLQADYDTNVARQAIGDFLATLHQGKTAYFSAVRQMGLYLYGQALKDNNKSYFLDKTPRYYHIIDELKLTYPSAKFIFLLRNPLAVLSSIIDTWVGQEWGELKHYRHDLLTAPQQLVTGINQLNDQAIVVTYENLVTQPESTIRDLCLRCGLEFIPEMLVYGYNPKPVGSMGDQTNIGRHSQPVETYQDKYLTRLSTPNANYLAKAYLNFLGADLLGKMGYNYHNLMAHLTAVTPDIRLSESTKSAILDSLGLRDDTIHRQPPNTTTHVVDHSPKEQVAKPPFLLSAIVSTYNAERFMRGRLQNLVEQTLFQKGELEIVVIDSNSPQNEGDIVKDFAEKYPNIVYQRTPQRETVYAAWNRGIKMARGQYIINANTDDRFAPDALERMAAELAHNDDIQAVYGDWLVTQTENDTFESPTHQFYFNYPEFFPPLLLYYQITSHAAMFRREIFDVLGYFDEEYKVFGDRDFMIRFALSGLQAKKISGIIGLYLENPTSLERASDTFTYEFAKIREKFLNVKALATLFGYRIVPDQATIAQLFAVTGALGKDFYTWNEKKISDFSFAGQCLLKALKYDPNNVVAINNLAIIFQMAGNRQEALNLLERALSQSGNYKALIEKNLDFIRKEFVPPLELDWIKPQIELQMDELKDKSPVISIIIPCYDRPEALAKCLDSLKVQTLAHDKFEVICVNDGSSDSAIRQVIETAFQELPGVYLEHSINRGRGQARNTGLKVARGQYLLFMDSDIQADPRLLEEHVIMHQNQSAKNIALLSKIDYPEEMLTHSLLANIFNQTTLVLAYSVMKPGEFYDHLHFYTGCISIPRQAFEFLGGFDETYQTYGVEDTEYGFRLEKAGYQILYHPAAHCIHLDKTPTIEDFCNRQRRIATNLATFFHAHPEALELTRWSGLQNLTRTRLQNHLDQIKPKLNQILSQVQQIERIDLVLLDEDALDTKQLLSATKDILFFLNDYYWNQGLLDGLEQYGFESFADFKTPKSEKPVKISVIIPTYNRSTTLKKCLDALTRQSLSPDAYEVIICDDGSTDDTAKIVSHFTAPFKLRYLSQSNKGPAAARNLGIKKAVGDYLLFMNDDTIAAPDLLLAHYQTHQNSTEPKISVLGEFKLLPEHNQSLFTHVLEQSNLLFGYTGMEAGNLYNYTRFYTCNLSLPRQAVIDVGSFDEDFTGPAAEDLDLGYRLQQQGYRVLYQPNCVAWHDHRITPEGFCKTHVTRGLGAVVLFSKHPEISDFKDITPHVVAEWRQQQPSSEGTVNQLLHQLDTFTEPLPQASALRQQQDVINQIAKVLESLWLFHYRKGILSSPWLNKLLETTLDFDRLASQDKLPKSLSPKVSVVIPCYNYAHYLSEAVDSVLSQTYQNFEVIIVNDGSTDNTDLVANQLITQNPKQHIRLIHQSNSGQPAIARNVGIAQAAGQYILCLDADDKLEPTFLEKTVSVLDGNPEISIAFTHIQHFGAIDSIWSSGPFALEAQIRSNNIPYCALYRREVFDSVGGYATNVRGYEDWDFWLNTLEKEWQGQLIPEPLFYYRKGHESVLGQANQNSQNLMAQIILNHPALFDPSQVTHAQNLLERDVMASKKYRITYLITSILGVTGGNQTLLQHTNYLTERGHDVSIVTYTDTPAWFEIKARVIKVPHEQRMARYVPPSDVVISTYFMNTAELLDVDASVKIYFAQGDQYIFADNTPSPNPQVEALRRQMQELSKSSYFLPDIHFVANSHNLARTVEKSYGRKADAIIPACTDQTIFRPLPRAVPGSRWRILVVGPDTRGSDVEPLTFKGISDIKEALQLLSERFTNFTTIRMSNSPPDIFKDFPCEFYIAPPDEMKTFLYGTAHILVYASHYDSCPLPPQEAMAAGAAVICTATSGAMEYCVHEENSLLVPIKSPPEIAQAIERLITDPELREKLIQGGFTTAQEHPRERAWHKLETVIDRFVARATKFPDSSSWTPGIINRIEKPQENCFTYSQPVDPAHRHIQMSTVSTGDRANGHHSTQPSSQISSNNHKPIGDTMTHDGILDQMIASAQAAGHWPQAISLLQEAVKYAPPGPTQATLWNSLGYSFFQAEQPVEAEAAFQEGIRIEPQNMDLLKNLIDLYRQQDQLDKATEYLNRGLRIDPDDIEILLSLGECAIQLGAFDVAEMAFVRVKALAPETAGIDEILAELFGTGQSSNGSLNGTAPSDDVSIAQEKTNQILAKGQAALEANDLTGAAQEFAWVVAQYPDLAAGHMALGGALLALGQAEAAITPLRRVVELLPELAAGYNQLGVAYYRAGHQAEAEPAFKQAHQLDPLDLEPCLNLIDLYRGQRHFGEARTMVEVASSINANHVEVQIATGLVNAEMGNFGEARHSLTKLEGVAPTHPGVTALRSLLNDQANQMPDLISQVETAQAAGNWPQAITLLKAALPQPSHQADPALWNSLGVSHFHAGQITEAETALTHGLKFDPNNLDLLSNLANLYLQQEQFDQATAYANKALRIDPNHIEALIVLGHCCIRLNVFDTALTAFRRVAELAPGTEGVDLLVTELESMVAVSV